MAHSSFGRGWPNCNSPIVTLVRSDGLQLPVHGDLVEIVRILVDFTELKGYDVKPGQTWGYSCRAIKGTDKPSNHSWGTAIDINAPSNPRMRPLTTDIPPDVRSLWTDNGWRWGGGFSTTPDPMHFEFMGSVNDARDITTRLHNFLGI
jgi:D-alanyl-D-alanine carboxypeptidase